MVDVDAVLDYTSIYEPHVDKTLAALHTLVQTQHQWMFEAVAQHEGLFPHGVKTLYRAYSANRVVEFARKHAGSCYTRVGRLTGRF